VIRLAGASDLPRLVEMGLRFRRESEYQAHISENASKIEETMGQLIARGGILVSERPGGLVGMIGIVLFDHFFSGERMAGEVFFWIEPEHRGDGVRLLREAEKWAKRSGALRMQMISPNDRVSHFYERCGYGFVEASYQRTL
jgi:GNAT superfamily N-acetyltransferase